MGAMELVTKKNLMLFAGRGNEQLSKEIAEHLKVPLGEIVLSTFANGELYCRFGESIRGADVFILQSHCEPINERKHARCELCRGRRIVLRDEPNATSGDPLGP